MWDLGRPRVDLREVLREVARDLVLTRDLNREVLATSRLRSQPYQEVSDLLRPPTCSTAKTMEGEDGPTGNGWVAAHAFPHAWVEVPSVMAPQRDTRGTYGPEGSVPPTRGVYKRQAPVGVLVT